MPLEQHSHFATILASTVHDIKNSLGAFSGLIQQIKSAQADSGNHDLDQLEFEADRVNQSLLQLLTLYKIDSKKFCLSIDEHPASAILDEIRAMQSSLLQRKHIELKIDCAADLMLFCDQLQISNALATIVNNAERCGCHLIRLSATQTQDHTCFIVEDDGPGYAPDLLEADPNNEQATDWVSGGTGLGLYFVAVIAALHRNAGKTGFIRLDNDSTLGGARFRLFLP